jgi:hypothetical protein
MKKSEAFSSDKKYFAAKDFNGPMELEIETVRFEKFENDGKSTEKPVVYFRRTQPGLVVGPTVWDQFIDITGEEDTVDWRGHRVELYRTQTTFRGGSVPCLRVR